MPSSGGSKPGPTPENPASLSHVPGWKRHRPHRVDGTRCWCGRTHVHVYQALNERAAGASTRKDEDTDAGEQVMPPLDGVATPAAHPTSTGGADDSGSALGRSEGRPSASHSGRSGAPDA